MQRLKMHSVSIFLLLQGVIVRREDRAVSGGGPAKDESIIFSRNRPVLQFDWH